MGEVEGEIVSLKSKGLNGPFVITVKYQVNKIDYSISETVKVKSSVIKVGPIPIGQTTTPVMGEIKEGTTVTVKFDEENPSIAIIKENDGFKTS